MLKKLLGQYYVILVIQGVLYGSTSDHEQTDRQLTLMLIASWFVVSLQQSLDVVHPIQYELSYVTSNNLRLKAIYYKFHTKMDDQLYE